LSLQHETIHCHPTRHRRLNEAIGRWPLSLWPYSIYRATHLAHHRDANLTDPLDDPESYYWTEAGWGDLGPVWRAVAHAQTTLLGRVILGPAFPIGRFVRDLARPHGETNAAPTATSRATSPLCAGADLGDRDLPYALWIYVAASSIPARALRWCARSPNIAPCPRPSGVGRSSRAP
jgi:fatty acid desaturase